MGPLLHERHSLVQDAIQALRTVHMRSNLSLRGYPKLHLKQFQCVSDTTMTISPVRSSPFSFLLSLFPHGSRQYDVHDFVSAGSVSSSPTLQIFWNASHLWRLNFSLVAAWSCSLTPACPRHQIQYIFDVKVGYCNVPVRTHHSICSLHEKCRSTNLPGSSWTSSETLQSNYAT